MRPSLCVALFAIGLFATGCERDSAPGARGAGETIARSGKSPYDGPWVNVSNPRDALFITAEGEAFIVQDETRKKFAATMNQGVLRVSGPVGGIDILHVKSSDRLIAGGDEYRRMSENEAASFTTQLDTENARRESMERIRRIAMAWEARATDINSYEVAGIDDGTVPASLLGGVLRPTYIRDLPSTDAWGNPFVFSVSQHGNTYTIESGGAGSGLVFSNGSFR